MKDDTQHRTQTDTRYSDDVIVMFRQIGKSGKCETKPQKKNAPMQTSN
jgi:hypothetical protein